MECLRDYIGIKGCGIAAPDSGMYINSLPGIEFKEIEQIANADQVSYVGVWADVQDRAIERFRIDVLGRLSGFDKRYKLRQITQTVDLGQALGSTIVAGAYQRGLVIELNNPTDQLVCSNMQAIYVQSVKFYCINAGAYILKVKDADNGTVLDSFNVTGAVGWNVTKTDKYYDASRVSITVDASALDTRTLDLTQFNLQGFSNNSSQLNLYGWDNGGLWMAWECSGAAQVRGYQTDINYQNPVYGSNTFGISCVFSVRCTYNNIVCKNKRYFASAFRLALGIELMTERIYSSRINRWTTIDLAKAHQLRKEFEAQYRGGPLGDTGIVYESELAKACDSIDLDLNDCCLECDAQIEWRETQM